MVKCNDDVDGIKKPFFKVFRKSTDTIYGHIILAAVTCASYLYHIVLKLLSKKRVSSASSNQSQTCIW